MIARINVRCPIALMLLPMAPSKLLIVDQDCANFKTLNCKREQDWRIKAVCIVVDLNVKLKKSRVKSPFLSLLLEVA